MNICFDKFIINKYNSSVKTCISLPLCNTYISNVILSRENVEIFQISCTLWPRHRGLFLPDLPGWQSRSCFFVFHGIYAIRIQFFDLYSSWNICCSTKVVLDYNSCYRSLQIIYWKFFFKVANDS